MSGSSRAIINIVDPDLPGTECFQLSASKDGSGYAWVYADHAIFIAKEGEVSYLFVPVKAYAYAGDEPDHRIEMIRLRVDLDQPSVEIAE